MSENADEEGQAVGLHNLSMLHRFQEDYASALTRSEDAEVLNRKLGREVGVAGNLYEQGAICDRLRFAARAAADDAEATLLRRTAFERFSDSLAISHRIGYEAGVAASSAALGKLLMDEGRMREAIEAFNEALEINQRLQQPAEVGIDLELLGGVHERQGQFAAALEKYQQALELARKYMSPQEQAVLERDIAGAGEDGQRIGNG